jgi:hypothetical protein
VAILGAALVPVGGPNPSAPSGTFLAQASNNFDQLVVVLMENKNQNEVYGPATYMTQLADQYGFAQHWASITNPSQPNYIAYIGGSTFGVTGDGNHPNLNYPTIVDLLENTSKTWKAFAEDASGTGCGLNPPRGEDHFPFLSFTTITSNSARCANLLPGSGNEVISAFNAGTNFIWLTPNDCNNMHSCSVATGDNWIHSWVPTLLSAMSGKKAALIITFDEAYTNPPYIYHAFIGTAVKSAYKSSIEYTHYSLAKLIEDVWGGGNLGQNDVTANSPLEFFLAGGPDFSLAANPTSVSFNVGQSASSTVSFTPTGGFSGTIVLTAASTPSGVTTSCVPSSISGSQTSMCTLSASSPGSYSVTITGTNGTLVHETTIDATVTVPDFSLSANPNGVSFVVNQSGNSMITLQSTNGFSGTVDLTAASTPSGVTTSCVPSSISGSQTSTCTLSSATPGSYSVTITGMNGTLVHETTIDATVTVPDFSLSAIPISVSFIVNQSANSTITLQSTNGFAGTVDLTAAAVPSGVSTSCSPSSLIGSGSAVCTFNAAVVGTYTVTITGTSGSLTHSASIDVTVTAVPQPDFSLLANPTGVSFEAGQSAASTIQLQPTAGFNGIVDLTADSTPSGLTISCAPSSISGTDISTCSIGGSTPGSYTATVTGTSATLVHNATITVTVQPPSPQPDFTLYADPDTVSFIAGESASVVVGVVSSGGFASPVQLSAASVPGGITTDCSPSTIDGSGTATCDLAGQAVGYYRVLVTGTSGALSHSVSITVQVDPGEPTPDKVLPNITITSPPNSSVIMSQTATVTVTGNASDNLGIEKVELSTDNVTWIPANGTDSWSGSVTVKPGTTTIYARATDTAGNRRVVRISVYLASNGAPLGGNSQLPIPIILLTSAAAIAAELALWRVLKARERRRKGPTK